MLYEYIKETILRSDILQFTVFVEVKNYEQYVVARAFIWCIVLLDFNTPPRFFETEDDIMHSVPEISFGGKLRCLLSRRSSNNNKFVTSTTFATNSKKHHLEPESKIFTFEEAIPKWFYEEYHEEKRNILFRKPIEFYLYIHLKYLSKS